MQQQHEMPCLYHCCRRQIFFHMVLVGAGDRCRKKTAECPLGGGGSTWNGSHRFGVMDTLLSYCHVTTLPLGGPLIASCAVI
jgi:hypothetical protein